MPNPEIKMSTTDNIPGERRAATECEVSWSAGHRPQEAYDGLAKWARENRYEAVIGVHFVAMPFVSAPFTSGGSAEISTEMLWTVYGTCIKY